MNAEQQEKYRIAMVEKYEQRAWECLALYQYHGGQYATMEKQMEGWEKTLEESTKKLGEYMQDAAKRKDPANKDIIAGLKDDKVKYTKRIENSKEAINKYFKLTADYQNEAMTKLEQVEMFKTFKVKTPEQIADDRAAKKVEEDGALTSPVVADEKK